MATLNEELVKRLAKQKNVQRTIFTHNVYEMLRLEPFTDNSVNALFILGLHQDDLTKFVAGSEESKRALKLAQDVKRLINDQLLGRDIYAQKPVTREACRLAVAWLIVYTAEMVRDKKVIPANCQVNIAEFLVTNAQDCKVLGYRLVNQIEAMIRPVKDVHFMTQVDRLLLGFNTTVKRMQGKKVFL